MLYGVLTAPLLDDDGDQIGAEGDYVELTDPARIWLRGRDAHMRLTVLQPAEGAHVLLPVRMPEPTDRMQRGGVEA